MPATQLHAVSSGRVLFLLMLCFSVEPFPGTEGRGVAPHRHCVGRHLGSAWRSSPPFLPLQTTLRYEQPSGQRSPINAHAQPLTSTPCNTHQHSTQKRNVSTRRQKNGPHLAHTTHSCLRSGCTHNHPRLRRARLTASLKVQGGTGSSLAPRSLILVSQASYHCCCLMMEKIHGIFRGTHAFQGTYIQHASPGQPGWLHRTCLWKKICSWITDRRQQAAQHPHSREAAAAAVVRL